MEVGIRLYHIILRLPAFLSIILTVVWQLLLISCNASDPAAML